MPEGMTRLKFGGFLTRGFRLALEGRAARRNRTRGTTGPGNIRLWIVAGHKTSWISGMISESSWEWCYFGTEVSRKERVSNYLSHVKNVSIADDLNRTASGMKQAFLDWLAEIGTKQESQSTWWASRLASKSPLQTNIFLLICYTQLVTHWLSTRHPTRPGLIVVVEDPWLFWTLRRKFAAEKRVAFCGGVIRRCIMDAVYWLGRMPLAHGYFVGCAVATWIMARTVFSEKEDHSETRSRRSILLYTWIDPRCFSMPGNFVDSYTGRLDEILGRSGQSVKRLLPIQVPFRLLRQLKKFATSLIISARHLKLRQIFASASSRFRIDGIGGVPPILGVDCNYLLFRELLHEWGSTSFLRYDLWYRTCRRMARTLKDSITCIIYPFENQPWEKLLCLAWRAEAPAVRLVGYQHSSVSSSLLLYLLGKGEAETTPLPDWIVANGDLNLSLLKLAGYPAGKLLNGGALRYEYFYTETEPGRVGPRAHGSSQPYKKRVLVAFSVSPAYSENLFFDLTEVLQKPLFVDEGKEEPVEFILKWHPAYPINGDDHRSLDSLPWVTSTVEPMSEVLQRSDLFVYVPPTTSWWEAYLHGIPVLKYQVDLLDLDSDVMPDGIASPICHKETLRRRVKELLMQPGEKGPPGQGVIHKMFGPVDEGVWINIAS
jgi:hypothetical protein